jgi:hypothetical protein
MVMPSWIASSARPSHRSAPDDAPFFPSPATMSRTDPLTTAQAAKRTTILLRESRGALRRLDKLTAMAAAEDPLSHRSWRTLAMRLNASSTA